MQFIDECQENRLVVLVRRANPFQLEIVDRNPVSISILTTETNGEFSVGVGNSDRRLIVTSHEPDTCDFAIHVLALGMTSGCQQVVAIL